MTSYLSTPPPSSLNSITSTSSSSPFSSPLPQDENDESIYNLIPPPSFQSSKPRVYRSKFPPTLPPSYSTFGAATAIGISAVNCAGDFTAAPSPHRHTLPHANFGPKTAHSSDTKLYQKKATFRGGTTRRVDLENNFGEEKESNGNGHSHQHHSSTRRSLSPTMSSTAALSSLRHHSPIKPKLDDKLSSSSPHRTLSSTKSLNFIKSNAISAILSTPKPPSASPVQYVHKSDYGQVPSYLSSVKSEIQSEKDYIDSVMQQQRERENEQRGRGSAQKQILEETDRVNILTALKARWSELNKAYLLISHNVGLDGQAKIRRKEMLEKELTEVEKAMEKMEKSNIVIQ